MDTLTGAITSRDVRLTSDPTAIFAGTSGTLINQPTLRRWGAGKPINHTFYFYFYKINISCRGSSESGVGGRDGSQSP